MHARTSLALGLVLLWPALAPAQQQKAAADFRETILQLDANSDMVVERDEVPESGRAAFDRLLKRGDANKNGKLEFEELRALANKVQAAADPAAVAERFKAMDKDKDGKVARPEFTGLPQAFDRFDTDKDGSLSMEEARRAAAFGAPAFAGPQAGRPRLAEMDKDKDGKVSKAEFTGPAPLFDRLDANKDGFVSRDEFPLAPGGPAAKAEEPKKPEDAKTPEPAKPEPSPSTRPAVPNADRLLKRLDKDKDGKVTRAEFGGAQKAFDRLDADKDGILSKDELLDGPAKAAKQAKKVAKTAKPKT